MKMSKDSVRVLLAFLGDNVAEAPVSVGKKMCKINTSDRAVIAMDSLKISNVFPLSNMSYSRPCSPAG